MGLQIRAEAAGTGARSDYYAAALRFIDPQLTPDSPLADVHTAAIGRRQQLLQQPIRQSREDLLALDEALDYVRAYRLNTASAAGSADNAMEVLELPGPGVASVQSDDISEPADAAVPDSPEAGDQQEHASATASTRRARGRPSLRDVMAQARPADTVIGAPQTEPTVNTAVPVRQVAILPETRAWPVLLGLLLILWQSWLALFAGWTVARFLIWPGPGVELRLGWLTAAGLLLLGGAAAVSTGILVWRYRRRTGHLLTLVHLTAGFIALDLAAWRLAASDAQLLVDPPRGWYWLLLIGAWLIATVMAWLHDLRAAERPPQAGQSP